MDFYLLLWLIIYSFAIKVQNNRLMTLRKTLKERRRTLSLTQKDLAEMAELSLATVKDIERGKGNPSLETVSRIMDVLGMEIVYRVRRTIAEEL